MFSRSRLSASSQFISTVDHLRCHNDMPASCVTDSTSKQTQKHIHSIAVDCRHAIKFYETYSHMSRYMFIIDTV